MHKDVAHVILSLKNISQSLSANASEGDDLSSILEKSHVLYVDCSQPNDLSRVINPLANISGLMLCERLPAERAIALGVDQCELIGDD